MINDPRRIRSLCSIRYCKVNNKANARFVGILLSLQLCTLPRLAVMFENTAKAVKNVPDIGGLQLSSIVRELMQEYHLLRDELALIIHKMEVGMALKYVS